jgi:hypothetical protein
MFGHPITLQYKNEAQFKSTIGGFMTIIVLMGLLTYCGILLQQMFSNKTFTVISDLQKKNVALDEHRSIHLSVDNFDIGIGMFYTGKEVGLQDRIDEYFSYTL